MTWYAASIIIGIRSHQQGDAPLLVHENVVLIEAATPKEAIAKASDIGKVEAALDDGLTINGRPANRVFAGVRKVINISNPDSLDLDRDRPTSGSEITYSVFQVENESALRKLAEGEKVEIEYLE